MPVWWTSHSGANCCLDVIVRDSSLKSVPGSEWKQSNSWAIGHRMGCSRNCRSRDKVQLRARALVLCLFDLSTKRPGKVRLAEFNTGCREFSGGPLQGGSLRNNLGLRLFSF